MSPNSATNASPAKPNAWPRAKSKPSAEAWTPNFATGLGGVPGGGWARSKAGGGLPGAVNRFGVVSGSPAK